MGEKRELEFNFFRCKLLIDKASINCIVNNKDIGIIVWIYVFAPLMIAEQLVTFDILIA